MLCLLFIQHLLVWAFVLYPAQAVTIWFHTSCDTSLRQSGFQEVKRFATIAVASLNPEVGHTDPNQINYFQQLWGRSLDYQLLGVAGNTHRVVTGESFKDRKFCGTDFLKR